MARGTHRWTARLGIFAMLVSLLALPLTAAAVSASDRAPHPANHAAAMAPADASAAAHHPAVQQHAKQGHAAPAAAKSATAKTASVSHPCAHDCPDCPKHGGNLAQCLVKCFQSAPLSVPALGAALLPMLQVAILGPVADPALTARSVPPLLRPPIA